MWPRGCRHLDRPSRAGICAGIAGAHRRRCSRFASAELTGTGRARRPSRRDPRPAESFALAVARAREWHDQLRRDGYSEMEVATILRLALGLWADVAVALEGD